MEWDWKNRSLRISVGELAGFSLLAAGESVSGRWRAELGTHWHRVLRERTEEQEEGWEFERPISGVLSQEGWQFHLAGRIDQFKPDGGPGRLREIKTISLPLPADEADLRSTYPAHFHQTMLYAFLASREGDFSGAELVFLEIETGLSQTVVLGDADLQALRDHLGQVVASLEERRSHLFRLRTWSVPAPFTEWREGQLAAREALLAALEPGLPVLFEAPTGFGKTGIALEQALRALASGEVERILLLTGKNTGHSALLAQLSRFIDSGSGLTAHAVRSRKDHSLNQDLEGRMPPGEIMDRWRTSGLTAHGLLADGLLGLKDTQSIGERHGIPPWAISRMLLPSADVWIADYNYLFDPAVSQVFTFIPTWNPRRTLLIVDEAHNLPGRAAASRSHQLDRRLLEQVLTEVQLARFTGPLARRIDQLLSLLKRIGPCEELDPPVEADLMAAIRSVVPAIGDSGFGEEDLSDEALEWLYELPWLLADLDTSGLPYHISSPAKGRVQFACLDAAAAISPVLGAFHRVLLMSATLRPWEVFREALGFPSREGTLNVQGHAPWLEGCFEVMVDARVDTRFRHRSRFYDTTARTIGETALTAKGCIVAFFPSYRYAEAVLERFAFLYPTLRAELQPRDLPLEEQQEFLETGLVLDDVLFLVLGSRFSEGIDALGGKVARAIVVSPALPEVNALQRAREALVPGGRAAAFRSVYLVPAMRKVSQSLGRLVRSPEHRAHVLLHGKRFIEPDYLDLLPEYLQPVDHLITDEDFVKKWVNSSP